MSTFCLHFMLLACPLIGSLQSFWFFLRRCEQHERGSPHAPMPWLVPICVPQSWPQPLPHRRKRGFCMSTPDTQVSGAMMLTVDRMAVGIPCLTFSLFPYCPSNQKRAPGDQDMGTNISVKGPMGQNPWRSFAHANPRLPKSQPHTTESQCTSAWVKTEPGRVPTTRLSGPSPAPGFLLAVLDFSILQGGLQPLIMPLAGDGDILT